MNRPGADNVDLLVLARTALLDALEALAAHRDAVIVIGAQAIYLRTAAAPVALAEATKDSDLAVDPRDLSEDPRLEEVMTRAGFRLNPDKPQPGAWVTDTGVPVDLMVPEAFAGGGGKQARGARIPPHSKSATRRAAGLEAVLVDNSPMTVSALDPTDGRSFTTKVAGSSGLLVAKLYKVAERVNTPDRLVDKDAHDIYRILIDVETSELAETFARLQASPVCGTQSATAIGYLQDLFAEGPDSLGSMMAGRAEVGIGAPATVAAQVSELAKDLVIALGI